MPPRKKQIEPVALIDELPEVPETDEHDYDTLMKGDAVVDDAGGEAVVLRVEAPFAFIRVGRHHGEPVRVPLGTLKVVPAAEESDRHWRLRMEARIRREI